MHTVSFLRNVQPFPVALNVASSDHFFITFEHCHNAHQETDRLQTAILFAAVLFVYSFAFIGLPLFLLSLGEKNCSAPYFVLDGIVQVDSTGGLCFALHRITESLLWMFFLSTVYGSMASFYNPLRNIIVALVANGLLRYLNKTILIERPIN